jgi:magnesium transporter
MNFNPEKSPYNMPELEWYWGYAFAWGIMLLIAGSLVFYFWRKGWFKSQGIDKKLLKKIQIAEGISEKK